MLEWPILRRLSRLASTSGVTSQRHLRLESAVVVESLGVQPVTGWFQPAGTPAAPGRTEAVHLTVLSSAAIAQPLFDLLARNVDFLLFHSIGSIELFLLALLLIVAPPAAAWLAERAVAAASRSAARALHLFFVAVFFGLFLLATLRTHLAHPLAHERAAVDMLVGGGRIAIVASAGGALLFALAYVRVDAVRSVLSVAGPAPIVFALWFLFVSDAGALRGGQDLSRIPAASASKDVPIVMLIFDEMPVNSLLNADGRIDAERYPNFAALAATSTWYRRATTAHGSTSQSVPSILTSIFPERDTSPAFRDHPRSLFTLLRRTHDPRAEEIFNLCPSNVCRSAGSNDPVLSRLWTLTAQAGDVYAERLESAGAARPDQQRAIVEALGLPDPAQGLEDFRGLVEPRDRKPPLYFLHVALPHGPFHFLPSGQRYLPPDDIDATSAPGTPQQLHLLWQRHLLQAQATDRALGLIIDRLRDVGLWDSAAVAVLADHGISFRLHRSFRDLDTQNIGQIGPIPLFVKLPRQQTRAVSDVPASSLDVMPTLAAVAGVKVPWKIDGRSLLGAAESSPSTVSIGSPTGERVTVRRSRLEALRRDALRRQIGLFGQGDANHGLFGFGPRPDLVNRSVADLATTPPGVLSAELRQAERFLDVDTHSDLIPAIARGRVIGGTPGSRTLAVALNGRIAATTSSYENDDEENWSTMLLPSALRDGINQVQLFEVIRDGTGTTLSPLPLAQPAVKASDE